MSSVRGSLTELIKSVTTHRGALTDEVIQKIIKMVTTKVFRTLPKSNKSSVLLFEKYMDETPTEEFERNVENSDTEPSVEQLKLIYDLFLKLFDKPNFQYGILKNYIDGHFIVHLLEVFHSEYKWERDFLKTIIHRIYDRFIIHRRRIRKEMLNTFIKFIYETDHFYGVSELLEVLGCIINGFQMPIRDEHKTLLEKVLIPLHKTEYLSMYHGQLVYCLTCFIKKDPSFTEVILKGLIKYWPKTSVLKEILFIDEIEELLNIIKPNEFTTIYQVLFKQIAKCISSINFVVAERALNLWNNQCIVSLIKQKNNDILPIVFPALFQITRDHWSSGIVSLAFNVLKIFYDINSELMVELAGKYQSGQEVEARKQQQRVQLWEDIKMLAAKNEIQIYRKKLKNRAKLKKKIRKHFK